MLKTVKLHNFKTFLNTELDLAQRHLLLGKNTSGKTSFANALQFLAATVSPELDRAADWVPGGMAEICNWYLKSDEFEITCVCQLELDGVTYEYTYELKIARDVPAPRMPGKDTGLHVVEERLSIRGNDTGELVLVENDGRDATMVHEERAIEDGEAHRPKTRAPKNATMLSKLYELETNRRAILFREYLKNWQYFSLSPLAIRRGALETQSPGGIGLDSYGQHLSNAIYHLKNIDERRYRRVIEHANIVEPSLRAINFFPVPDRPPVPFVELDGQPRASWNGLSDGTLRALGLGLVIELASMYSPPNWPTSALAIIEEPENGIFPGQVRQFFDLFEEWAPTSQFIFTSHSSSFIDMFDDKRGSVTIFNRLTDRSEIIHPRAPEPLDSEDRLTLSMEYASELFE